MTLESAMLKIREMRRKARLLCKESEQQTCDFHRGRLAGLSAAYEALQAAEAEGDDAILLASLEGIEERLCRALSFCSPNAPLYAAAREAKLDLADAIELLRSLLPSCAVKEAEAEGARR